MILDARESWNAYAYLGDRVRGRKRFGNSECREASDHEFPEGENLLVPPGGQLSDFVVIGGPMSIKCL